MTDDKNKAKQEAEDQNKDAIVQPDKETLNTTDPQENMEGPVSSLVKKGKEEMGEEGEDDEK
jgi:hypothetical protein